MDLKKLVEMGEAPDCFATQWMKASQESQGNHGMDDIEGAFVAGSELDMGYTTTTNNNLQLQ